MPNNYDDTSPNSASSFASSAGQVTLGATIIQLRQPQDMRPAVESFADSYTEAQRANPNTVVIGQLLEEHHTPAHLIFQYMAGLAIAKRQNGLHPVMAYEAPHNLLEDFFKDTIPALRTTETQLALKQLQKQNPARYQRLQLMAHASLVWPRAHVTRHVLARLQLEACIPTRMVDLAKVVKDGKAHLDRSVPETEAFIKQHYAGVESYIATESREGMRLRNLFMLSHAGPNMLYMTGVNHTTGSDKLPYKEQMHALAKTLGIVPVTSFAETLELSLHHIPETSLGALLTDPYATIIRGADDYGYDKSTAPKELLRAQIIFIVNGLTNWPADIQTVDDVMTSAKAMKAKVVEEVLAITRDYAPKPRQRRNNP